ncbi:hypothetical protein SLS53_002880 [Cytospora paraplurivora]|uniref:Aminoglycoside phosphotransferase domain-containing protein n=1 Tax=Cytospora paraplurivora TaxID=2898453 RepID=A0AAN9YJN4_9PEZI
MRVSLPVHPHLKTRGEVATLQWVRDNTDVPVPKVIAFQDNNQNEIGFEWVLMELMPGSSAYRRWRTMSMEQKVAFTERLAEFQAQLSRCGDPDTAFRKIGTLDADYVEKEKAAIGIPKTFAPGQVVSHEFFMGDRLRYDVPRGPFRSSHDWLSSGLRILILEQTAALERAEDEDDKEDAEENLHAAQGLLSLLPKVFPEMQDSPEVTAIWHDDLNLNNILVDDEGKITAVVDWECVSALPIWIATKMPKFLEGGGRQEEPKREDYSDETPQGSSASENDGCEDDLNNEGKNQLYWIHLMEYEVTRLQEVYDTKLRQLWPDRPVEDSHLKLDFFEAILHCSAGFCLKQIETWVDSIGRGEVIRWADI